MYGLAAFKILIAYCFSKTGCFWQAQASSHWKFGQFEAAYELVNVVQGGIERNFGSRSEFLPSTFLLMGLIHTSLGELREAEQVLTRAHDLGTAIWGEGCVAASNAMFAIALVIFVCLCVWRECVHFAASYSMIATSLVISLALSHSSITSTHPLLNFVRKTQVDDRRGEYEQAELKFRRTMQAREDLIGPLHSYLQQDMAATSLLYYRIEGTII